MWQCTHRRHTLGVIMHLIRSSAFMCMCRCLLHAHIVYSDKSVSLEFGSRKVGLDIVEQALKEKKIDSEEACAVIEQLVSSPLPTERGLADEALDGLRKVQGAFGSIGTEVSLSTDCPENESAPHHNRFES